MAVCFLKVQLVHVSWFTYYCNSGSKFDVKLVKNEENV